MNAPVRERFVALDSWRGIAAVMVVLHHVPQAGFLVENSLVRHAWLFVDFFFVLSGFVIASAYYRKLADGYSLGHFMALRLGRLFPLHATMVVLFALFFMAMGWAGSAADSFVGAGWPEFVRTLYFLQIFASPPLSNFNFPSWSIAAEFWVYGLAALGIAAFRHRIFAVAALVAAVSLWPLWVYGPGPLFEFQPGIALARALFGFALGMIVWQLSGARTAPSTKPPSRLMTMCEVIAVAAIGGLIAWWGNTPLSLLLPLVFAAASWLFSLERGAVSRLLRHRAFVMLGALSYAIYIGHVFVIRACMTAIEAANVLLPTRLPQVPADLVTAALLAATLGFAWLIHRWIERPARSWTYRWVGDRDVRRTEAIAPTF